MARPTILTPEMQKTICDSITAGIRPEDAAQYAGVSLTAFYTWQRRGKLEEERLDRSTRAKPRPREAPFMQFAQAVKKARLSVKRTHLLIVQAAGREHWQASAWMLERCWPQEFGQKVLVRQQVEQELEAALDRLEQGLDAATFARVAGIIAADGEQTADPAAGEY